MHVKPTHCGQATVCGREFLRGRPGIGLGPSRYKFQNPLNHLTLHTLLSIIKWAV